MKHNLSEVKGYEGISECGLCGGAEGELPAECPGTPMTEHQRDGVFEGRLEFFRGRWWEPLLRRVEPGPMDEALNSGDGTYKP